MSNSKQKKYASTLIELVLSLMLLSLLLSSLFFAYHTLSRRKSEWKKKMAPIEERSYLTRRLENIFSQAACPFYLSENDPRLIFAFNRGIYDIPALSGACLGCIYFSPNSRSLCMTIWPGIDKKGQTTPHENFVLLDNIESVKWKFYHASPPSLEVQPEKIEKRRPSKGWNKVWIKDFKTLPSIIKLTCLHRGEKVKLFFSLDATVEYPKDKFAT